MPHAISVPRKKVRAPQLPQVSRASDCIRRFALMTSFALNRPRMDRHAFDWVHCTSRYSTAAKIVVAQARRFHKEGNTSPEDDSVRSTPRPAEGGAYRNETGHRQKDAGPGPSPSVNRDSAGHYRLALLIRKARKAQLQRAIAVASETVRRQSSVSVPLQSQ